MQWMNDWQAEEMIARARQEAMTREMQRQLLLAQLPELPARWRLWTGGSLLWLGARLTRWGEQVADVPYRTQQEVHWS